VIEELVVRELLIRQTNPHDRRVSRVSLTPNGEALRSRLLTLMTTCESEVLAELDPAERSTVETGLSLLDAAIGRVLDRKQSLDTETPVRKPWRPAR
jgi:DNA-binding MarR family transcriptional regulator